ncbi:type III pantothenate kinase [Aliiroseovarius sp. F47248L]|uniref:type III pantothenate kinase n=1 Tax=Aliiroseovarius sp. F47248L TaxID=2926420 RepID=UPI001FF39284|nr:type III pantothenate kinase [Aliiroseovarius sp. F47248L]MCK0138398.1 type III pantothenate kinase [Aliiroseovarius sp. F47248L]
MLLAIDCGNTNTAFSIWDGDKFLCTMRTSTHHSRTADAYFTWFSTLINHYGIKPDIDDVVVSSTVPRVVWNLRVFADRFFGCRPLVVGKPDCLLPVPPRVDQGATPGPDRLANAVAAFERYGGDCMVVDFGTATNIDVVAHDGAYIGGVIAPGVNLSLEALHQGAAALPHVDVTQPDKVIGSNTVGCIQSGIFWGYVGLVQGLVQKVKDEYGLPMKVIGTGGLAPLFEQGAHLYDEIDHDLTMHGLVSIYKYNKEQGNI